MPNSIDPILINNLSCSFRGSEALHDVSMRVPRGSVFGLVGLNGAGKTTIIRHLIGALRASSGTVRVLGEDPTRTPESVLPRVGYVAEEDILPRWMRVGELIDFRRAFYREWDDALCDTLLRQFGIDRDRKLADLSKGGRARVGLLVAIAYRPQLLILDEPSYGLDPIAREDILEVVVKTASDEGRTVLFSSHLLDEVTRVCDTVAVIHEGRIRETVSVQELPDRYTEITVVMDREEKTLPAITGIFGWRHLGREWSAVIDRKVWADTNAVLSELPLATLTDARPATLDRWFAAHVSLNTSRVEREVEEATL